MNKILTKEVSFELAKFLKEIGYKEICTHIYDSDGKYYKPMISGSALMFSNLLNLDTTQYAAPTIADMVDYIWTNHNLWINVYRWRHDVKGFNKDFPFQHGFSSKKFNTQIEAYEHAIKFIYENKI